MSAKRANLPGHIACAGLLIASFVLTLWPAGSFAAEGSAIARDARVGGDLRRTRFVADLSETVEFRAFLLSNPYRVIVDLPEVKFQMPSGAGGKGKGLISAFRYGLFASGKSRIVIDVVGPVLIDNAFVRATENGQPARLVIDLVKTSPEEFERQREQQSLTRSTAPGGFKTDTESTDTSSGAPNASGDGQKAKPTIVLDPGHGGVDPGTISVSGYYEKDIVFEFCKTLQSKLKETGRYRVLLTRDDDIFVPLDERVEYARKQQAELLVSVHADALDIKHPLVSAKMIKEVRGASVYTLSEDASDELARLIAARENRSDILAGVELPGNTDDDLAIALIDLMHRNVKHQSIFYSKLLLGKLNETIQLTANPHRFANFKVLKAQDVPSVLIELGYLSNVQDESSLTSEEWRAKVADAFLESINAFFTKRIVSAPG